MHKGFKRAVAIGVAISLVAGPSRALVKQEEYVPTSWGSYSGTSAGGFSGGDPSNGVTVTGSRNWDPLSSIFVINVPYTGSGWLTDSAGLSGEAMTPEQKEQCIKDCDSKQAVALDLCNIAAAKAAAGATITAIGTAFSIGALVTWVAGLRVGSATTGATYMVVAQLAKDYAHTMQMTCIGQASAQHARCLTGQCKV